MKSSKEPFKMFTAGPVNVSQAVKDSMAYPEIGHREPEFSDVYKSIREKLLQVFGANSKDYSSFVVGASGTGGIESVLSGTVHPGREMLVLNNGAFGDRIAEICEIYKIPTIRTGYQWGQHLNLGGVEKLIVENPKVEVVSMVFMETSTGMINPVKEVGELCKRYDKMFVVDAVSGLAGDPLNVQESNVDFCISNTNKGLSGLPVISFVCAKKNAIEKVRDIPRRNFYLSMIKHYDYAEDPKHPNQTPTTPQIPLFYMLNQALTELLEEGLENRHQRYHENSTLMRRRLDNLGFKFQLPEEQMSRVMTNVLLPRNYKYEEFHTPLKERGYIVYPGKGPLENKIIHIANVGTHTTKDVDLFCDAVAEIVKERKVEY